MAIAVRRADLEADCRQLIDTLQTNLPHLPHERYFEWLYRQNPEGRAAAWVATNAETGRIVGIAAAFPRRVYHLGDEAKGYILGDFCVDLEHRSLGLALALQRACLTGLADEGARFAFDFPSDGMMSVYSRLRIAAAGEMIRHAKPLRADRQVAERVAAGALARGVTAVANTGLRWRDAVALRRPKYKMASEAGPWGEEFTRAGRDWSPATVTSVARTAAYLNWRYGGHPQRQYEMVTARDGGKLLGYLVQHMQGVNCTVDDLMAETDEVRRELLAECVAVARGRGVQTLSTPWLSSHVGCELLKKCGFRARESRPVVLLSWPGSGSAAVQDDGAWYLSHGDWES